MLYRRTDCPWPDACVPPPGDWRGPCAGWVRLVYGNDGWDVICDYSASLDPALAPVMARVDQICDQLAYADDSPF